MGIFDKSLRKKFNDQNYKDQTMPEPENLNYQYQPKKAMENIHKHLIQTLIADYSSKIYSSMNVWKKS